MLKPHSAVVSCLYFERDYFKGSPPPCRSTSLGKIEHGKYLGRLWRMVRSLTHVSREARQHDILYCFGLDMLLLGIIASRFAKVSVVYEVGDIRDVLLGSGLRGRLMRRLERFLIGRCDVVVVTSERYLTHYYEHMVKLRKSDRDKFLAIENKLVEVLRAQDSPAESAATNPEQIVIGYFGLLRCNRSWQVLQRLVEIDVDCKFRVEIYGKPMNPVNLPDLVDGNRIRYFGEYVSPDQLPDMYGSVDVVWACYPYGSSEPGNWQWARTNRFYEACAFGTPLLVLKGSGDAPVVEEWNLGLVLDLSDVDTAAQVVRDSLNRDFIVNCEESMSTLPQEIFVYSDEHERLAGVLSEK